MYAQFPTSFVCLEIRGDYSSYGCAAACALALSAEQRKVLEASEDLWAAKSMLQSPQKFF